MSVTVGDDLGMQIDSSSPPPSSSTSSSSSGPPQSVQKVLLSSDAFYFCMTQCLSTEVEEVMGLLIGELDENNGRCLITNCLPLKRLDKRKDRVEIGIEQLGSSFHVVDELNAIRKTDRGSTTISNGGSTTTTTIPPSKNRKDDQPAQQQQVQVIGWYHSHPHITVFPSEVDIATHHQYQSTMSPFWLGLIFGVFNYDDNAGANRFQLIAFQSISSAANGGGGGKFATNGGGLKHVIVPIQIDPRPMPMYDRWTAGKTIALIDLLLEEEKEALLSNQGGGQQQQQQRDDQIGHHYNACMYSKAVAKVIALFASPLMDALKEKAELALKLK